MTSWSLRASVPLCALSLCFPVGHAAAQSYGALARAFADAPLIARVRVAEAVPAPPDPSPAAVRFYVESSVVALIRAPAAQAPKLVFLTDLPRDSRGKPHRPKKAEWLIAARPAGAQVQLTAPPIVWTAEVEARVRSLLAEVAAPGAPAAVQRISGAFHSPGNVPGESETQIFFELARGGRGSLSVLRRPGAAPAWSASFGEVASDGPPPKKETLGWYRLACGLPPALPGPAVADLDEAGRTAARADYAFVVEQIGRCDA